MGVRGVALARRTRPGMASGGGQPDRRGGYDDDECCRDRGKRAEARRGMTCGHMGSRGGRTVAPASARSVPLVIGPGSAGLYVAHAPPVVAGAPVRRRNRDAGNAVCVSRSNRPSERAQQQLAGTATHRQQRRRSPHGSGNRVGAMASGGVDPGDGSTRPLTLSDWVVTIPRSSDASRRTAADLVSDDRLADPLIPANDLDSLRETLFWLSQPGIRDSIDAAQRELVAGDSISGAELRSEFGLPPR